MKTMVILGNDKISALARKIPELASPNVILVVDKSTSIKRVLRLIARGRLSFVLLLKMLMCEICRPYSLANTTRPLEVRNNKDLLLAIAEQTGIAIRNAQVRKKLKESVRMLNEFRRLSAESERNETAREW